MRLLAKVRKLPGWQILGVLAIVVLLVPVAIQPVFWPGGFGFGEGETVTTKVEQKNAQGKVTGSTETTTIDEGKTLWDWLSLLGVPLTLAVLGVIFQQMQRDRDEEATKEEILQSYFDRLSALLIDHNILAIATKGEEITLEQQELLDTSRDIIQARTLSILRRFEGDGERKGSVIRFLIETEVISKAKLGLSYADLSGAKLRGANLCNANLSHTNLSHADLSRTKMGNADLRYADLRYTDLYLAKLENTNLHKADLRHSILSDAVFSCSNLKKTKLSRANFSEADLSRSILSEADLSEADLSEAILTKAQLDSANLRRANLRRAKLFDTNLYNADLSFADLSNADLIGSYLGKAIFSNALISSADLSNAILLATDLHSTDTQTQVSTEQLEGEEAPLLCNVALPEGIAVDSNRDCDRLPEELLKRYPEMFPTLEDAQAYVDKARQKQWD